MARNIENDVNSVDLNKFRLEVVKFRKSSSEELLECVRNEIDPSKYLCQKMEKILSDMDRFPILFKGVRS